MTIDVIIPLYHPGKELLELLDRLNNQSVPVHKIILMNTEKKYLDELMQGQDITDIYGNVEVHHLSKEEFDHGGTRHAGVLHSTADIFVCMTQDAKPVDGVLIEKLTHNLQDKVAVAYGRQLPGENSSETESVSRLFNYPEESLMKTREDLPRLGIKTYFCSNVCAAYRRDVYEELGGFIRHTIFNEDMIYAAGVIKAGYTVSYEAEAKVVHSHSYSNWQQLRRNFDLGVSQADHPEIFCEIPSEAEGRRLVKKTLEGLIAKGRWYKIPGFMLQCVSKYAGYLLGRHYNILPKRMILSITMNREYWK